MKELKRLTTNPKRLPDAPRLPSKATCWLSITFTNVLHPKIRRRVALGRRTSKRREEMPGPGFDESAMILKPFFLTIS